MQAEFGYPSTDEAKKNTEEFELAIKDEKHPSYLMNRLPVTVGFTKQLKAAVIRQYQILKGDLPVVLVKQGSNIIQALSSGSLFYNTSTDSSGIFLRSGAIFVAILFNSLIAQSEVTDSFSGRPVGGPAGFWRAFSGRFWWSEFFPRSTSCSRSVYRY